MNLGNLKVSWKHEQHIPQNSKTGENRNKTTCFIKSSDNVVLYEGSVSCYHKDRPNRRIALKESFKKAVSQIPNKVERTNFWNMFFTNSTKCKDC